MDDESQSDAAVNQVVTAEELEALAWSKAEQLASKPPEALRQTKILLRRRSRRAVEETMQVELEAIAGQLVSEEVRGMMQAFFERRERK